MSATVIAQEAQQPAATRNTIQRALVLEAVRALHHHPTSSDVYDAVREKHPNISRATVYRNLGVLAEKGEVLRVEVPNAADRYDFFNKPHYHAQCQSCGGIFDIDVSCQFELPRKSIDTHGFKIEGYRVIFDGECLECQTSRSVNVD